MKRQLEIICEEIQDTIKKTQDHLTFKFKCGALSELEPVSTLFTEKEMKEFLLEQKRRRLEKYAKSLLILVRETRTTEPLNPYECNFIHSVLHYIESQFLVKREDSFETRINPIEKREERMRKEWEKVRNEMYE